MMFEAKIDLNRGFFNHLGKQRPFKNVVALHSLYGFGPPTVEATSILSSCARPFHIPSIAYFVTLTNGSGEPPVM